MTGRMTVLLMMVLLAAVRPAAAEKRVALVVGNAAYSHTTPLANPANDARGMADALTATGFKVIVAVNADRRALDGALRKFTEDLADADVGLFFYAGHGLQVGAHNYLVPIDAKLERERDLEFEVLRLDFVLRQMEIDREGKTSIVILDACRDNPLTRSLGRNMGTRSAAIGRGLASAAAGVGTFIAFATQPGNVALDGAAGNSPFTASLARQIRVKGRNLPATMIAVRNDVIAATGGKQVPWDHSALTGDFFFLPGAGAATGAVSVAPAGSAADIAALQARLAKLEAEAKTRDPAGKSAPPATPPAAGTIPPVTQKAKPQKLSAAFEESDNVGLSGTTLATFKAPSPLACRSECEKRDLCSAFQHGKKAGNMGQCDLYSAVTSRNADQSWRSGVRRVEPLTKVKLTGPLAPAQRGFVTARGQTLAGEVIKEARADGIAGCLVTCANTTGCVAATHDPAMPSSCTVLKSVSGSVARDGATAIVHGDLVAE